MQMHVFSTLYASEHKQLLWFGLLSRAIRIDDGSQESDQKILELLKTGVDINQPCNRYGSTILHLAYHPHTIQQLLDHKAQVDIQDHEGITPLHNAHFDKIKLLVKHGASITLADHQGYTALHYITDQDKPENFKIIQYLLEQGADIDAKSNDGKTALDVAHENHDDQMINFLVNLNENETNYTNNEIIHNTKNIYLDEINEKSDDKKKVCYLYETVIVGITTVTAITLYMFYYLSLYNQKKNNDDHKLQNQK